MNDIDIYLVHEGEGGKPILPQPTGPFAYLVTRSGPMIMHTNPYFEAVVPATKIPMLAEVRPMAVSRLPAIPAAQVAQCIAFFREVYHLYKGEAMLIIAYRDDTQAYAFVAPEQIVSSSKIDYDLPQVPEGYVIVGTVHSHGSGRAFYSPTDDHDDNTLDGIHLTIGCLDRPAVEIAASLVVGGSRFEIDPTVCLAGLRRVYESAGRPRLTDRLFVRIVSKWKDQLNDDGKAYVEEHGGLRTLYDVLDGFLRAGAGKVPPAPEFKGYVVDVPDGTPAAALAPEDAWLDAVAPEATVELYDLRRHLAERVEAEAKEAVPVAEGGAEAQAPTPPSSLAMLLHAVRIKDYRSTPTTAPSTTSTTAAPPPPTPEPRGGVEGEGWDESYGGYSGAYIVAQEPAKPAAGAAAPVNGTPVPDLTAENVHDTTQGRTM